MKLACTFLVFGSGLINVMIAPTPRPLHLQVRGPSDPGFQGPWEVKRAGCSLLWPPECVPEGVYFFRSLTKGKSAHLFSLSCTHTFNLTVKYKI